MGIRKNEVFRILLCMFFFRVTEVVRPESCVADTKSAVAVLASTYHPSASVTVSQAKASIAALEKAVAECGDALLTFRIKYRIGVLSFRAEMFDAAKARFAALAKDSKCPALIRISSYNMVGQISRLAGENMEALAAFNDVVKVASQELSAVRKDEHKGVLGEVLQAALFGRAEIYELNREYGASIGEYERLLGMLDKRTCNKSLCDYTMMVRNRISQLHLRQGDVEKYMEVAKGIVTSDTEYGRRAIVELEMVCVKVLKGVDSSMEFSNGSFETPAKVIAYVKAQELKAMAASIIDKVGKLCKRYTDGFGAMVVSYHYAWLLDAVGERDEAAKIFGRISSGEIGKVGGEMCNEAIARTVVQYAKIQYAIMLGESGNYREALGVLSGVLPVGEKTHISGLTESVSESIRILKRELGENENRQE